MTWGVAVGQLRQYRRQTVLVLVVSIALLVSLLIPAGLYLSYRDKVAHAIETTVLPGELIVTADAALPGAAVADALRAAPQACALSQFSGQVVVYTASAASASVPGSFLRSDGGCAGSEPAIAPGEILVRPGTGVVGVMGSSGARATVTADTPTPTSAAAVRFADEPTAREILGVPGGYTLVTLAGPDARAAADRLAAAGGTVSTRAAYLDRLAGEQIANVSFVGVIAITFIVVLIGGLTAALVFSLALLAMQLRPQLDTLRRIGVSRSRIRAVQAVQAALMLAVAAVIGTLIAVFTDAAVPPGRVLLGTFPVDGVLLGPAPVAAAWVALAVVFIGAWFLGDAISSGTRQVSAAHPARLGAVRRILPPVVAVGAITAGLWSTLESRLGFGGLVAGYCLVLVGLFLLAAPALRVFRPFGEIGAARGRLLPWFGIGSVARVRTQAAVAVSCIGFTASLVSIISVFATSTDASINRQIDANVGAQVVIEPKTGFVIAGSDVTALRGVPGLAGVVAVAPQAGVDLANRSSNGVAIDGRLDSGALQIAMVDGAADTSGGQVLLSRTTAADLGARVGDSLPLAGTPVRIGGIYGDAPTLGDFVVPADPSFVSGFQYLLIKQSDPAARAGIDAVAATLPNLAVRSISEYTVQQKAESRVIIAALTQLSTVVGAGLLLALGVVLGVLTGGRLREWATFRRLGFSRGLVLRTVGVEGAVVAIVGVLAGLAVGSAFGYAVCKYLRWVGLTDVVFDPVTSAGAGVALVAIGVVVYVMACSSTLRQLR
ncbi:hypothetical protein NDR87_10850 [Nocardia sp. CDC159]|uniref:ABC transport system permease protein n=1 Tax=Nocardia pulmonis TaxID=2951408 RepID=A0A9X2E4A2_9NOCA|nr:MULTISPECIES: hypothetical protein [Nocardia]MCM6773969.1 hypothetical protein [Nocardia pulmonis]MCM6786856.1 hypothetical protein [Nocardia sp. CDC159]